MRKMLMSVGFMWLLSVAVVFFGACSHQAHAGTPIASSASGDYVGGGWSCRLLAYAHPNGFPSTVVEYHCTDPQSIQRLGGRTWWGCPTTQTYPERLWPWWTSTVLASPPDVTMNIVGLTPASLTVTFDGALVVMSLAQSISSPAPYSCSAARFRVFGP